MKEAAIVILNYNGEAMLQKYLPQVISNSVYDIVVIDNGSNDGSISYLQRDFPEIRLVLLSENHGYSKGYNLGLKELKDAYSFYLLLNSDVEVSDGWDQTLVGYLLQNPKVAACQPKVLSLKKKGYFDYAGAAGGFLDQLGYPFCRGRILHLLEEDQGQYDDSIEVDWASGACFCVKSAVFHDLGGFNPFYFSHMEEIDLCWRMRNKGYKIHHCGATSVYHLGGGTLSQVNPLKTYLNFRNSLYMLKGNLELIGFIKVLILRMILDAGAFMHLLLTKGVPHSWAIIRAYRDFVINRDALRYRQSQKVKKHTSAKPLAVYCIIWSYYLKGKKKYSEMN
ncbi:MAG: glycosyltransferase family 2 protein [Cytophagales bacterium]|uniref:glycosyltransferase family 2 protein n=1 Tax=Cyclobacterium marinum TaxID=104 RepID=UPI0030DC7B81|nr:glycosyltransferase family 2 protein [Cytophagales bacterium]|tara:strand:- start:24463 stop:25473 length:1011 start_codon:yes stop_codon:yes gene_type:complete